MAWRPDGTPFPASECPCLQVLVTGKELRDHADVFVPKDGSLFPVVFSAAPLLTDGQATGTIVAFRDDTDRTAAERKQMEIEKELRSANADLEQFAYTASHDLEEPLRTVRRPVARIP